MIKIAIIKPTPSKYYALVFKLLEKPQQELVETWGLAVNEAMAADKAVWFPQKLATLQILLISR